MRLCHAIVFLGILLEACSARPTAELVLVKSPNDLNGKEIDQYAFPQAFFSVEKASGDGTSGEDKIELKVVRKNYEAWRIGIRERKAFGVRTNLNVKKIQNTDLIEDVGAEVFDDRLKAIGRLGETAGLILGLVGRPGGESEPMATESHLAEPMLPYTIDTVWLMEALPRQGSSEPLHDPTQWQADNYIRYWFGPVSPDAQEVSAAAIRSVKGGLVYAGCRTLVLFFPNTLQSFHLTVPDPRYFRIVKFPRKGKITFAPDCGVSITSEKDASIASNAAVMQEVFKQLNELKSEIRKTGQK
ncbi:hypothetical protein [Pedomonas sp. V897]|uniref:hypothetical protein n=1 Tax=Pedomonas sp. V897 TaxID=3446482 RepID=UPI003EE01AE7